MKDFVYWLIDYAADPLAQHCYNNYMDKRADCCPLPDTECPFGKRCNKVNGDNWRLYLVDKFNNKMRNS